MKKLKSKKRFKVYRNHVVTLSRICKKSYYKEYCEDNRKNADILWSGIRSIINIKSQNFQSTVRQLLIAILLLIILISDKLLQKFPKTDRTFNDFLNFHNENSFFI